MPGGAHEKGGETNPGYKGDHKRGGACSLAQRCILHEGLVRLRGPAESFDKTC